MNKSEFITLLGTVLFIGLLTYFVERSNPERPEKLPAGVSIVVIDGQEYIKLVTPTGASITPKQNCGGE
jgi:hypothetical protein